MQALWVGRSVFLLGFFGVLLGLTLSAGVDRLQRYRIPRGLGAAMLVVAVVAALVGLGFLTAPQISSQMREVRDQLPQAVNEVRGWVERRVGGISEILEPDSTAGRGESKPAGGEKAGAQKPRPSLGQGLTQQLSSGGQGRSSRSSRPRCRRWPASSSWCSSRSSSPASPISITAV